MENVLYCVINKNLKMSPGKIASQVGHAVHKITSNILREYYECNTEKEKHRNFRDWENNGSPIVILKATQEECEQLFNCSNIEIIFDFGRTEVPNGSLTVIGFYPGTKNKKILKGFQLF